MTTPVNPLDAILHLHGSDKSTVHQNPHRYARFYEKYFAPLRESPIVLLEIGVANGNSIRAWLEYFPNARIYGLDIAPGAPLTHERYVHVTGDQGNPEFWREFVYGDPWDVVIDDGGHRSADIITSFNALWPRVKPGGLYAIEDLYCAYLPEYQTPGKPDTMSFIRELMDYMNRGLYDIEHLHFSRELAIFKKASTLANSEKWNP